MPQDIIQRPPVGPKVDLPQNGPDDPLQKVLRSFLVGIGAEEQAPGDLPGFLGATASLLPVLGVMKKLGMKLPKGTNMGDAMLRDHVVPTLPGHEFSPDVQLYHGIPVEEMEKAEKMGATGLPKRRKGGK